MKKKTSIKNILVIALVLIVLIIIGFFVVSLFKKNTNDTSIKDNNIHEKYTYKTRDDRFVLQIVEKDNDDAYVNAKIRYGEDTYDEIIKPIVRYYAYLNNRVFAVDEVVEDDNYAVYSFVGLPTEEYGHKILVNKTNNIIEVSDDDLKKVTNSCLSNGFCGFQSQPSYIKSNTGYYFVNDDNGLVTIYTNKWKKIGYVDNYRNIQLDVDGGIYAYEQVEKKSCSGNYCDYEGIGTAIKYDINGDK